jgi:hypothetical protein
LQNEILQDAWYSVEAESKLIFGSDPQQVWHTLLNRAQPANVVDYKVPTTVWLAQLFRGEDRLSDRWATTASRSWDCRLIRI